MYGVHVYHGGQHVGSENIGASSVAHAHKLAAYIPHTVARNAVHPTKFNPSKVSFSVHSATTNNAQPSAEVLKRAGFVKFPLEVSKGNSGARCSTCEYSHNQVCTYNDEEDLRGLNVDYTTCCNFWDHKGTKKGRAALLTNATPNPANEWPEEFYDDNLNADDDIIEDFPTSAAAKQKAYDMHRFANKSSKLADAYGDDNAHRMAAIAHRQAADAFKAGWTDSSDAQQYEGYHQDLAEGHMSKATEAMLRSDYYGQHSPAGGGYERPLVSDKTQAQAGSLLGNAWSNKAREAAKLAREATSRTYQATKAVGGGSYTPVRGDSAEAHNRQADLHDSLAKYHDNKQKEVGGKLLLKYWHGNISKAHKEAAVLHRRAAEYKEAESTHNAWTDHAREAAKATITHRGSVLAGNTGWTDAARIAAEAAKQAHKRATYLHGIAVGSTEPERKAVNASVKAHSASQRAKKRETEDTRSFVGTSKFKDPSSYHFSAAHDHEVASKVHSALANKTEDMEQKQYHQAAARHHTEAAKEHYSRMATVRNSSTARKESWLQQPTGLTKRQKILGLLAHKELQETGHNPASWIKDEDKWEKAKKAVGDKYGGESNPRHWAVVTHIYERMGGKIKGKKKVG